MTTAAPRKQAALAQLRAALGSNEGAPPVARPNYELTQDRRRNADLASLSDHLDRESALEVAFAMGRFDAIMETTSNQNEAVAHDLVKAAHDLGIGASDLSVEFAASPEGHIAFKLRSIRK